MSRTRAARWTVAVLSAVLLAAPAGASAFSLGLGQLLDPGTTLNGVQSALSGLTTPLTDALCPPTGGIPGVGFVTCNLDVLSYSWHTQYKRADGTMLTRDIGGLIEVPTLLDVDEDGLPDVVATITVSSLDTFDVKIDRLPGETAKLPLAVEAIVKDPTKGSLPRQAINFGYDARAGRAPQHWQSTIHLLPATDGVHLKVDTTQSGAQTELDTVAGLFDGTAAARKDVAGGVLRWQNGIPATQTVDLAMGDALHAAISASSATTLGVDASYDLDGDARKAAVSVDQLPAGSPSVAVDLVPGSTADQRTVTYSAAAPITSVTGSYRHLVAGTPTQVIRAALTGVPTGVVVHQTGAQSATVATTGGALGSVQVGFANGEPKLLSQGGHWLYAYDDGTLQSFAGRIEGLRSADVSVGPAIHVGATLKSGPLEAKVQTPSLQADAKLADLPAQVDVDADLAGGHISYDGHGATIGAIDAVATAPTPLFARARRIDVHVRDLPPKVDVDVKPGAAGVAMTASAPIGLVEAGASDDVATAATVPGTDDGVSDVDKSSAYRVAGRIHGLQDASFKAYRAVTGPPLLCAATHACDDHYRLVTDTAGGPFSAHYETDGVTVDANVANLPSHIDLDAAPGVNTYTYDASSAIDSLQVDLHTDAPFATAPGLSASDPDVGLHAARLSLKGIPASFVVTAKPTAGGGMDIKSTQPIGEAGVAVSSDTVDDVASGLSQVKATITPGVFRAAARLQGFQEANFSPDPLHAKLVAAAGQLVGLTATLDSSGDQVSQPGFVRGTIGPLPGAMELQETKSGGDDAIQYVASAPIARIALEAGNLPGGALHDGAPHALAAELEGVPSAFTLHLKGDTVGFTAGQGQELGWAWLTARDDGTIPPADVSPAAADGTSILFRGTKDDCFCNNGSLLLRAGAAHVQDVTVDTAAGTTAHLGYGVAHPGPIDVDARTDDMLLTLSLPTPPQSTTMTMPNDGSSGLSYDASAPVGKADVTFALADTVVAGLSFQHLPSQVQFCLATGETPLCGSRIYGPLATSTGTYTIPHKLSVHLHSDADANDPMIQVDGRICIPPAVKDGQPAPAWNTGGCLDPNFEPTLQRQRIELTAVKLKDFDFELASGDSIETHPDGTPIQDDLLGIHLDSSFIHTAPDGFKYIVNNTDDESKSDTYIFASTGTQDFKGHDYTEVVDTTGGPLAFSEIYNQGYLDCGNDSKLDPNAGFDILDLGPLSPVQLCKTP